MVRAPTKPPEVPGSGFRVPGSGFLVSGSGFRVPGSGFRVRGSALAVIGAIVFVVLATANAAGYRYGVSDQAFYVPAFMRAINPSAFPRDAALIDAQARLMVLDEVVAGVVTATGLSLEAVCLIGYLASLLIIWVALLRVGRSLYATPWAVLALTAAFTLRHQITKTSTNSFEPYFHPRMLAFAVGALAIAALLRGRTAIPVLLIGIAALVHVTTAMWFAVLIGVALIVAHPPLRLALVGGAAIAAAVATWAVTSGPLAGALVEIDPTWRALLETKDTLFAHRWPAGAWLANLGTAAVWAWAYAERRRRGLASAFDTGLAAGGAALILLFLLTLPLSAAGIWLVVELQISRVFWVVDLLATVYAISALELRWPNRRAIRAIALALAVLSVARGIYILEVERPDRALFALRVPSTPWKDAMEWLARTPLDTHVLADPGHAWKYGTSVRVAAGRDVFHEEVKDTAVAIYSRDVAVRVIDRSTALGRFDELTELRARQLAGQYNLDYLVTSAALSLPVTHRAPPFTIYSLRQMTASPLKHPGTPIAGTMIGAVCQ